MRGCSRGNRGDTQGGKPLLRGESPTATWGERARPGFPWGNGKGAKCDATQRQFFAVCLDDFEGQRPAVRRFSDGGGVETLLKVAAMRWASILREFGVLWGMAPPDKAGKKQGGRFEKGQSGNPAGKPKGTRHRSTLIAEQLIDGDSEAILGKCVDLAKAGDPVALRLCVERLVPRRTAVVMLELPAIARAADVASGFSAILAAAAAGDISLGEAREFMSLVDGARRAFEVTELAGRLAALEALEVPAVPVAGFLPLVDDGVIRPDASALAQLRAALDRRRDAEHTR